MVSEIKKLAHDLVLGDPDVYRLIDRTIKYMESQYNFNYMKVLDESVTIPAGTKEIVTAYPVKEIIDIDISKDDIIFSNSGLQLRSEATEDKTITISYFRHSPSFDGASINYICTDDWVVIYGATYFAMIYNLSPEAAVMQGLFYRAMQDMYNRDHNKILYEWKKSDAIGL